jgi:hypothetical protein
MAVAGLRKRSLPATAPEIVNILPAESNQPKDRLEAEAGYRPPLHVGTFHRNVR